MAYVCTVKDTINILMDKLMHILTYIICIYSVSVIENEMIKKNNLHKWK